MHQARKLSTYGRFASAHRADKKQVLRLLHRSVLVAGKSQPEGWLFDSLSFFVNKRRSVVND
jgi:hypothetical protein